MCGNLGDTDPCRFCQNPRRDRGQLCVVEEASDIPAIEKSGTFGGVYHVLGGGSRPWMGWARTI